MDKVTFLTHMLLMVLLAMKFFFAEKENECLVVFKYMLRLSTIVPDHKATIALFNHQGLLHTFYGN
jgi:tetratricopeptide (TPR) repeat protein